MFLYEELQEQLVQKKGLTISKEDFQKAISGAVSTVCKSLNQRDQKEIHLCSE